MSQDQWQSVGRKSSADASGLMIQIAENFLHFHWLHSDNQLMDNWVRHWVAVKE